MPPNPNTVFSYQLTPTVFGPQQNSALVPPANPNTQQNSALVPPTNPNTQQNIFSISQLAHSGWNMPNMMEQIRNEKLFREYMCLQSNTK